MKIIQQKMMSRVKEADVVVVNPTHYAVALMYNPDKAPAPVVLAKGVDFIAFKIREIAKNNNIPIVENKPLARISLDNAYKHVSQDVKKRNDKVKHRKKNYYKEDDVFDI